MVRVLSWNIQYAVDAYGRADLARTAAVLRSHDADILCLQEVSIGFDKLGPGPNRDQTAGLANLLPGYQLVFGPTTDLAPIEPRGWRRRFGNAVLSRLPVLESVPHILPRPAAPGMHMRRGALEALIETGIGALRVVSTHLEFHSEAQRLAQTERLVAIEAEATAGDAAPPAPGRGPYEPRPPALGTVICGDFNFVTSEASYRLMTAALKDAWAVRHGDRPHAPTCGIFDAAQWPQGPHARDFMFVSPGLAGRVTEATVDEATDASDHQPVIVDFA